MSIEFREPEPKPEPELTTDDNNSTLNELSIENIQEIFKGFLKIVTLKCSGEPPINSIENFFVSQQYPQLITYLKVLHFHYKRSDPNLSNLFFQMAEMLSPIIEELNLVSDPNYYKKSLLGVFEYIKYFFTDNKMQNSCEMRLSLYKDFCSALENKKYHMLFGMLISCQELFQKPDKDDIYDTIYELLNKLCPELE